MLETTIIYAGNERGNIVAAYLTTGELTALTGDAQGPLSCQRRANHNPYRAVRVALAPQQASISLRAAYRAQRKAAITMAAATGSRGLRHGGARSALRYGNEKHLMLLGTSLVYTTWHLYLYTHIREPFTSGTETSNSELFPFTTRVSMTPPRATNPLSWC